MLIRESIKLFDKFILFKYKIKSTSYSHSNLIPAIANSIDFWINNHGEVYTDAIRNILQADNYIVYQQTSIQTVREYIRINRPIPQATEFCSTQSTWCTTNKNEQEKCEVLASAGLTTGILPQITCKNDATNDVACLKEIQAGRSDFTGIDSNHGYLARE